MAESSNPQQTDTSTNTTFETAFSQEFKHLSGVHPTPKDIPTCLDLFNTWLACVSGKNQLKHVYRHGHMEDCGGKSKDWRFACWKLARLEPEEKRKAWLEWRARWWAERRLSGSSEDVWDIRTEPIKNYPLPPVPFILDEKTREFVPVHPQSTPSQSK